jgi:DNA mismatch repair protein MutS2
MPAELIALQSVLEIAGTMASIFRRNEQYPEMRKLIDRINDSFFPPIIKLIYKTIDENATVKDRASDELYRIRLELGEMRASVRKRAMSIYKTAQANGIVDAQLNVSIRDGRLVIPVLATHRRKLPGSTVSESSSGRIVFIEPLELIEINNQICELESKEKKEIKRILVAVADTMRPVYDDIVLACTTLEEIDFINAKARYAVDIDAGMPVIADTPQITLFKARHPLLEKALKKEKKRIVPLEVDINSKCHILLISGPNAGGKSVCLKTVGLLQYMLQCGLLVPASEVSEMGVFDNIFIDIGDEQSLEDDLSTYSSHLRNMKLFMKHVDKKTLVLIDEFGAGTEPASGGAIAESILSNLLSRGAFGLITTHYTNLKNFATVTEGIDNGAMLFDQQNMQPLFVLKTGAPGSSFAFEIARKIGIPENILRDAENILGDNQVNLEKSLGEIARDQKYWESKRDRIKKTDKYLNELSEQYEKELADIKELRRKLISEARDEAKNLLDDANRQIENTIRVIREAQAEKEATKLARQNLEAVKKTVASAGLHDDKLEQAINKVKKRKNNREKRDDDNDAPAVSPLSSPTEPADLATGDKVIVKVYNVVGEVVSAGDKIVTVSMGNILINVAHTQLQKIDEGEFKQLSPEQKKRKTSVSPTVEPMSERRLNFKPLLDVRGLRTVEALEKVTAFVDEATTFGVSEIRVLHGKGDGILKMEIRQYLKIFGNVASTADEKEELGGAGITVINLR